MVSETLTVYTTSWCGYCTRLKRVLDREAISYREVNIELDEDATRFVMSVNDGNQTVPTVTFRNGAVLTNPSLAEVKRNLARAS